MSEHHPPRRRLAFGPGATPPREAAPPTPEPPEPPAAPDAPADPAGPAADAPDALPGARDEPRPRRPLAAPPRPRPPGAADPPPADPLPAEGPPAPAPPRHGGPDSGGPDTGGPDTGGRDDAVPRQRLAAPPGDAHPRAAAPPAAAPVLPAQAGTGTLLADPPATAGDAPAAGSPAPRESPAEDGAAPDGTRFQVRLDNFEGPFDLLLQLIGRHKLDVTEVALSRVTDEFIAHIRAMGPDWDLDQATEFLVVAATLLDLKAARLLPAAEVEDEEDLALLEARDLLFARLLQYRAYKKVAGILADRWAAELLRHPRTVGLEPHHADLLPEVVLTIGPEGLARLAAKAMVPKPKPEVYVEHIHAPLVSVREQAEVVVAKLRRLGSATFRTLTDDAPDTLTVVARFLALLELYRERAVALEQELALGELLVSWTGDGGSPPVVTDEFDREPSPGDGAGDGEDKPRTRRTRERR
ncbi:hypothetical protein GCM10027168_47710 [Streptomyces capparidis]